MNNEWIFLNRLPEIFTLCPPTCPPFHGCFLEEVSPCSCAGANSLGKLLFSQSFAPHLPPVCWLCPRPLLNPRCCFRAWNHPKSSPNPCPFPSYQFQPCLLDGEYLSIRAVSLSRESFCSRRNWETDWFSTPGLVGREGRLCSLDQCSCRLARLEAAVRKDEYTHAQTHTWKCQILTSEMGTNYLPELAWVFLLCRIYYVYKLNVSDSRSLVFSGKKTICNYMLLIV